MFDYLEAEAYRKLKKEIRSVAHRILTDKEAGYTSYYFGQMQVLNEIIKIMNKIEGELYDASNRESEKEAAYYESELAIDESCSKQL